MAALVFLVLIFGLFGGSDAAWCVCRSELSSTALQKTLDYACGAGADCGPIIQNGPCYNPNTVAAHCSYAANSYYQRKGEAQGACDFSGTAVVTSTDPSSPGCTFPATPSAAGTSGSPTGGTTTSPGTATSPGALTPNTPSTGTGIGTGTGTGTGVGTGTGTGGVLGGLGPSGTSIDGSDGGFLLSKQGMGSLFLTIFLSGLVWLRT